MEITYGNPHRQYLSIKKEIDTAIQDCIKRSSFIGGYWHDRFEAELGEYINQSSAVVGSGTAAQQLSLLACGIGPGDEVIVPSMTFFSTAETVNQVGATPVFCDISMNDYCIDINETRRLITQNTRAIMPVDLYGQQCDYYALRKLCDDFDLKLIQDSAQSFGSLYHNKGVGTVADLAIHSFYPGKNLDCMGDGGGVSGNSQYIDRIRELRNHCREPGTKYVHNDIGWNHRCDGLQAAILSFKLKYIHTYNQQRRQNAEYYNHRFADTDLVLPQVQDYNTHVYNQYAILHPDRTNLKKHLEEKNIYTGIQFPRGCHQQPAYGDIVNNSLFNTEVVASNVLSLPVWPGMTDVELCYVADSVLEYLD